MCRETNRPKPKHQCSSYIPTVTLHVYSCYSFAVVLRVRFSYYDWDRHNLSPRCNITSTAVRTGRTCAAKSIARDLHNGLNMRASSFHNLTHIAAACRDLERTANYRQGVCIVNKYVHTYTIMYVRRPSINPTCMADA